jgi:protein ImuB
VSSGPTRVAVVTVPDWPAVAAGIEHGDASGPVVVLHAQRVVARTAAAAADGVRRGMRRREAQAACPSARVAAHQPVRDRAVFDPVVRAVSELVPLIEVPEPGTIVLPSRGPSRYFGGDAPFAARLVAAVSVAAPGARSGVAIADGRLAATVAAHHGAGGPPLVVPPGGSAPLVASLPVSVLTEHAGIDADAVSLFERLGIARLGDLAAIGEAPLVARFGPLGADVRRLALGDDRHPPLVDDPPPERTFACAFEEPVEDQRAVVAASGPVADELSSHLAAHGACCAQVHVSIATDHGEQSDRLWYEPAGLSAAAIVDRVRWQLAEWVEGRGPTSGVVSVRLFPVALRPLVGGQAGLWGGDARGDEAAARASERLVAMLGSACVSVPEWRGGRDPGRAFVAVPVTAVDLRGRATSPVVPREAWRGALPAPAPSVVLDDPPEAEVTGADGAPVTVGGRHELSAAPCRVVDGGEEWRVLAWAGPWPVEERWWDERRRRRMVRLHAVLGRDGDAPRGVVLALESGRWRVAARFG